jgi:3',5'-cyclic AMP phosphodiesterase CpdA
VDHVVVTGDLTHGGLRRERALFDEIFEPLRAAGRLTVVPGNHDRLGDDIGRELMEGQVSVTAADELHLVGLDSTGVHNRKYVSSYGELTLPVLEETVAALQAAPPGKLSVLLLHHHPLGLPEDSWLEWTLTRLGFRHSEELNLGKELLRRIAGHCDLVLHGHRHRAWTRILFEDEARPLMLANAGSSTESGLARLFVSREARLAPTQEWLSAGLSEPPVPAPAFGPRAQSISADPIVQSAGWRKDVAA